MAQRRSSKADKQAPKLCFHSRRSPVLCLHAAVATSQSLASEAGYRILRSGGNAADAAIAIAAALNVTEPSQTGLGGDCFALFYHAESKTVKALNGRYTEFEEKIIKSSIAKKYEWCQQQQQQQQHNGCLCPFLSTSKADTPLSSTPYSVFQDRMPLA